MTETTDFRLAIPVWRPLFTPLARRALRGTDREAGRYPWWSPPDRFDPRAARVLALLTVFAVISGYLGTLITQTITFAADEFGAGDRAQGVTLAAVRVGVLLALALAAAADRRGRRTLLIAVSLGACITAVTGAAAPSLAWLGASQTIARGLSTAMGLLIAIVAAEELPRNSRAYGVSVLALSAALGSGMAVWALPLADLAIWTWRLLYVIPLLGIPVVLAAGRPLPETRRFVEHHDQAPAAPHAARVWLLAASAFLGALFLAPASQFLNEFLRDEQGFSAASIAVFTLATNTPGAIGVLVGGHLADVRGRRQVGSISLGVGVALTVLMFLSGGWALWLFSVVAAVIGAATVPALGVYGPELFPTAARGQSERLDRPRRGRRQQPGPAAHRRAVGRAGWARPGHRRAGRRPGHPRRPHPRGLPRDRPQVPRGAQPRGPLTQWGGTPARPAASSAPPPADRGRENLD